MARTQYCSSESNKLGLSCVIGRASTRPFVVKFNITLWPTDVSACSPKIRLDWRNL